MLRILFTYLVWSICFCSYAQTITIEDLRLDTVRVNDLNVFFEYPYDVADMNSANRFFMEANSAYKKGNLAQAATLMKKAIKKQPNRYEYHHLMAYVMMDMGEHKTSVAYAKRAVRLKPNDWKMRYLLGLTKYAARDFLGASIEYSRAIEHEPTEFLLFEARAYAKAELGDPLEALNDFNLAIMLKPTYIKAYKGRGMMLYKLGNYQEAIVNFTAVLMREPDDASVYYYRGISRKMMGDIILSCQDFEKAGQLGYSDAYKELKINCNR